MHLLPRILLGTEYNDGTWENIWRGRWEPHRLRLATADGQRHIILTLHISTPLCGFMTRSFADGASVYRFTDLELPVQWPSRWHRLDVFRDAAGCIGRTIRALSHAGAATWVIRGARALGRSEPL